MTRSGPSSASPVVTGLAEDAVQNYVDGLCQLLHVAHYHTHDSRGSQRGFLDSFCIGPGGALVFECKDDDGKTTDEQDLWIWLLESIGIPVLLVRPEDMQPRRDLGGKSLIHHELYQISRDDTGNRFPQHIITAMKKSRSEQMRRLAAQIARGQARRGKR